MRVTDRWLMPSRVQCSANKAEPEPKSGLHHSRSNFLRAIPVCPRILETRIRKGRHRPECNLARSQIVSLGRATSEDIAILKTENVGAKHNLIPAFARRRSGMGSTKWSAEVRYLVRKCFKNDSTFTFFRPGPRPNYLRFCLHETGPSATRSEFDHV